MNETWTNLLSGAVGAIVGAIVGGSFSLLGTMYANKVADGHQRPDAAA
jgi:hypothetical protein